jgi:hypothetical protein
MPASPAAYLASEVKGNFFTKLCNYLIIIERPGWIPMALVGARSKHVSLYGRSLHLSLWFATCSILMPGGSTPFTPKYHYEN